jgi:hypothetical protein
MGIFDPGAPALQAHPRAWSQRGLGARAPISATRTKLPPHDSTPPRLPHGPSHALARERARPARLPGWVTGAPGATPARVSTHDPQSGMGALRPNSPKFGDGPLNSNVFLRTIKIFVKREALMIDVWLFSLTEIKITLFATSFNTVI